MSHSAVRLLKSFGVSSRAAWLVVLGLLVFVVATPRAADAITIDMEYSDEGDTPPHDENPSWDPSGLILKRHFAGAKQIWESLLPGPGSYEFDFQWDNDIDDPDEDGVTLGLTTDYGELDVFIEINPDARWFADFTPEDDSEFDFSNGPGFQGQTLFGGLTAANQTTYFPGTPPPGALEVGFRGAGAAAPSASGIAGDDASNSNDLLSTIVHEMGHVLGLSGVEPGEFNIYPHHVGGPSDVLVLEDAGDGHLGGRGAVPFLMCASCGVPGVRRAPSATDILVIAEDQGIADVRLQRVGSIASGSWGDQSKWIGADVPSLTQDAYIRHGGATTLDADAVARSLVVGGGSSLSVQNRLLKVDGALTYDGGTVSVATGGTIAADRINGDPAALTTVAGSLLRFNQFTRGASAATAANFNGSVSIGLRDSTNQASNLPFDPNTIVSWNVAEQLGIGDFDRTALLVIDGGAVFTSATGAIGSNGVGGGDGAVNISNVGSSWTIGGTLDVRKGAVNVVNKGLLATGPAAIGANVLGGRGYATVNDAKWNVVGNVVVGPQTLGGATAGTLTIQNNGRMTVTGDLNVKGTSALASQVTVETNGYLQVDGTVVVAPYGKVTYGADSTASGNAFTNLGSGDSYVLGGITQFGGNATAGLSTITNNGGTAIFGYGGQTIFGGSSTASISTITNLGPSGLYAFEGKTRFNDAASAGGSNITNVASTGGATTTDFYGTSTAAGATIINRSGPYATVAGITTFHDFATAGSGTFINDSALAGGNGEFVFKDFSSAGQGTFTNGPFGGFVTFNNSSTAGSADFFLRSTGNCRINFYGDSNAGSANIDVGPVSYAPTNEFNDVSFYQNSNAANATITVRGDGGRVIFADGSAGNATINVLGSTRPGNIPGTAAGQVVVDFLGTAGNATITAQPSNVAGAPGGLIQFQNAGHAGSATLIANGGATAVNGGLIRFGSAGAGDTARLVINAGAAADFSLNASHGGTAVGSIEGAGEFYLGSSALTVGNRNTSTNVSGIISDSGGYTAGVGGKLTKVGTGALTLSGANVYTGLTTVDEGTLVVNGSIVGPVVVKDGGTLKGTGSMPAPTVESGGTFAPGASPGTITVGGLNLMSGSMLDYELGAVARDRIVVTGNGNVTLGGVLNLSLLAGFNPPLGQIFSLFEGAVGTISGVFSAVNAPLFNGHTLNVLYGANEVTLQVGDANFLAADFDENGVVDGADLTRWRSGMGTGATHMQGNADGDGDVDGADFLTWQRQVGTIPQVAVATQVPEPGSLALLCFGVCGLAVNCLGGLNRHRWMPTASMRSNAIPKG